MYNKLCISLFLAFRYIAKQGLCWREDIIPEFPKIEKKDRVGVTDAIDIIEYFRTYIDCDRATGILLSSGIDSAILASFLPEGTKAYTARFIADGAIDESIGALNFADKVNLEHKTVDITWNDYTLSMDLLMRNKKSPLHAIEVALYKIAIEAKKDGVNRLIVGNGADSTFGGMDKLLSRDWTFDEFVKRYNFVEPSSVLKEYEEILDIYEPYRKGDSVNVPDFLKTVHGLGIVQSFANAFNAAGCSLFAPYESLFLNVPLDMERIRNNESKYILRDIFNERFPGLPIPEKIPFARPMDQWMKDWQGPKRSEFLDQIDINKFSGDQKWIIFCLERFMDIFEE